MRFFTRHILWQSLSLLVLLAFLCLGDWLCYQITLPIELTLQQQTLTLHVGSQTLALGHLGTPIALELPAHDPLIHEYQLDGTDSTNNFTLNTAYLRSIASSSYYRFQAWMRDLEGTSRWRTLQIWTNKGLQQQVAWPLDDATFSLPSTLQRLRIQLQPPETPMVLNISMADSSIIHITLDRNDRIIAVTRDTPTSPGQSVAHTFFPTDTLPFAAMVADFLLRTLIWAVLLLLATLAGEILFATGQFLWQRFFSFHTSKGFTLSRSAKSSVATIRHWTTQTPLHPLAYIALAASLIFVAWIAKVQYQAEPHIYDAVAYLFSAKIFALGQLSVPIPPASDRFPGPFMVQFAGRWFTQYAPGTGLTLAPGLLLGIPWLVEPLLGTLALLGIGLIAALLYNRRIATLAVLLGTLSPFYSYLAASYMSHTIALFYLVWGVWAMLRFAQNGKSWLLPLAAACFGMGILTRDLVALLFVVIIVPGILLLYWRRILHDWKRWLIAGTGFLAVTLLFAFLSLSYNAQLTGNPFTTPRTLFFAGDHWGFGQGVGFYGQHTLAAGFVNLDELLTSLAIDLFGWPFYCTLACMALPFLTRRSLPADWLLLAGSTIMTGAFIGYFYHGIYLGPRYLYETLPFLLILTARGFTVLMAIGISARQYCSKWWQERIQQPTISPSNVSTTNRLTPPFAALLLLTLLACNVIYYLPRQTTLYTNYNGLPFQRPIDLNTIYHPPMQHAIITTDDYTLYQLDLFPLNDPMLQGNVIYAYASSAADYSELNHAFPGRTLYRLNIQSNGHVSFTAITMSMAIGI